MYKLVFLDVDGTLVDDNKNISKETLEVINECSKRGVRFVIASGRSYMGSKKIYDSLKLQTNDTCLLAFNGALIYDLKTNKIIHEELMNGFDLKLFYKEINKKYYYQFYDEKQNFYVDRKNDASNYCALHNGITPIYVDMNKISDEAKCIKSQIVDPNRNLENVLEELKIKYSDKYSLSLSDPRLIEIQRITVSKGNSLKIVADYYNIPLKDTIAFGDGGNDYSMVKDAGLGIAMANATNEIKDIADYITLSNNESGVAYALKKFILENEN